MKTQVCSICREEKPLSAFYKRKRRPNNRRTERITCGAKERRKWVAANKPHNMWYEARRRANKRGLPFDITEEDVVIPEVCPALGIKMDQPSLDQLIPRKGYTRENIRVISWRDNDIKKKRFGQRA